MSEPTAEGGEVRRRLRSDAVIYLLLAATSALMGAWAIFGADPLFGLMTTVARLTGLICSGVGFGLWGAELPAALRYGGVVGLLLPWLGLLAAP